VLQSVNGVPVVAVRAVSALGFIDGIGSLPGGRISASQWLVPMAVSDRRHLGRMVLYNPGPQPARAAVTVLINGQRAPVPGVGPLTVPPGQWAAVQLPAMKGGGGPLVVSSSAPLYTESDTYGRIFTGGLSLGWGVPLSP
jgi:hypothetical protein